MSQTVQRQHVATASGVPTWVWAGAGGRLFAAYWGSLLVVDLTRGGRVGVTTATLALLAVVATLVAVATRPRRTRGAR